MVKEFRIAVSFIFDSDLLKYKGIKSHLNFVDNHMKPLFSPSGRLDIFSGKSIIIFKDNISYPGYANTRIC